MDQPAPENAYRKMLAVAISSILIELGADSVDRDVLGTLTEMMQSYITQVGLGTKMYCEINGRSEPFLGDVVLAFIDMGIDVTSLPQYLKTGKHVVLPPMQQHQVQKQTNMLQAGVKQSLPSHIPQHLPAFPDSHAYIRTPTHKQPVLDYETIREKFAVHKKDMEKALTKFLARTNPVHNLFDTDEANMFPLIACKPSFPPYLNSLLPQDQIFDPEDLEYDPKAEIDSPSPKKRIKSESKVSDSKLVTDDEEENSEINVKIEKDSPNWEIDNPYLAATKLPPK